MLSETTIQEANREYYTTNDYPDAYNEKIDNNQYVRHPINTDMRFSHNDIHLRMYFNKTNSNAFSPLFYQEYELEYYMGSKRVPLNYPAPISDTFNITIISQTSYF